MKKYSTILALIITSTIIVFFAYNNQKKKESTVENPFNQNININQESKNIGESLIVINGVRFKYEDLPMNIKQELFKEEMNYQIRRNAVLKSFAIRLYKLNEKNPDHKVDEVPPLINFIDLNVSQSDLEKRYQAEKNTFPPSTPPAVAKSQISFNILSTRAINFYNYILNLLNQNNMLAIRNDFPFIPNEWLKLESFPKLGNSSAKDKLIFIGSYLCPSCSKVNQELISYIANTDLKNIEVIYVNLNDGSENENIIAQNAFCLNKIDNNLFWKYHNYMTQLLSKSKFENNKENTKNFESFTKEALSKLDFNKQQFQACIDNKKDQTTHFSTALKSFNFLELQELPVIILNNKKLDIEARSLSKAIELSKN